MKREERGTSAKGGRGNVERRRRKAQTEEEESGGARVRETPLRAAKVRYKYRLSNAVWATTLLRWTVSHLCALEYFCFVRLGGSALAIAICTSDVATKVSSS